MDVRCERCKTEYEFDDSRITDAGVTVKCTTCGHVFKVKKKALVVTVAVKPGELEQLPAPAAEPAAPPLEKPKQDWKVRQASGNLFTFKELTTLQKWIVERKVARDDEISLTGDTWKRLGDIAELASFFQVVDDAQKGAQLVALQTLGLSGSYPIPAGAPLAPPGAPAGQAAIPAPAAVPPPASPQPAAPAPAPQPAAAVPSVNVNVSIPAVPQEAPRPAPAAAVQAKPAGKGGAGKWIALLLLVAALGGGGYSGYAYYYLPLRAQQAAERERAERLERERIEAEQKYQAEKARADEEARLAAAAAADAGAVAQAPPDAGVVTAAATEEQVADAGATVAKARPEPRHDFNFWMSQGDRLRDHDKAEAALDAYGKAVDLKPDRAEPFAGRGLALLDMGAKVQAEAAFRQALKLNARYGVALMGLAETCRSLGRNPEAVEYYRKYLDVLPNGPDAPVAKKAIERLGQ